MSQASGSIPVFTAEDDGFHADLRGDDWWFTETAWFSFHHRERRLGGWLYTLARHNIGTVSGGAWVWDGTAHLPWEVPYSSNLTALRLPPELDLRDSTLPNGVSIKAETPTMAYRLGYDDPGRFSADLRFEAVLAPRPLTAGGSTFGHSAHFDQIGRVTGWIQLNGEDIDIDCWSMRDRTWGRRPEDRPRQAAYVTGAGDDGSGFLAVTNTRDGVDRVAYGFVQRGDAQASLVDGKRTVRRSPDGWISEIRIDAVDAAGERFVATGNPVSRIIINRHSFIDINSLIRWEVDGIGEWWGEDQDMCPPIASLQPSAAATGRSAAADELRESSAAGAHRRPDASRDCAGCRRRIPAHTDPHGWCDPGTACPRGGAGRAAPGRRGCRCGAVGGGIERHLGRRPDVDDGSRPARSSRRCRTVAVGPIGDVVEAVVGGPVWLGS